jgi:type I restriction enzyme S subunit
VALPPLAEQRRIVAAIEEQLSRFDVAMELVRRASARLRTLRKGAVDSALAGDWPRVPLGEIAEVVGGVTKDSKRQQDPAFVEVPYLRVANVQRGYLDLDTVTTIRVPPATARALELKPGDVLFNEGGDRDKLGRGWVWSGEISSCIHQNHVFRARLRDGFEPRFVSWWGNSFGREWFWRHGRQTTNLASMSLSTLKAFPVPAPSLDEQRTVVAEIERLLSSVDHLNYTIAASLRRAEALQRSILACAFRGELVSQYPNDESAAALLERIADQPVAAPKRARKAEEKASA